MRWHGEFDGIPYDRNLFPRSEDEKAAHGQAYALMVDVDDEGYQAARRPVPRGTVMGELIAKAFKQQQVKTKNQFGKLVEADCEDKQCRSCDAD